MATFDIRRADSRGRLVTDWLDAHFSFAFGEYRDPQRLRFGALRVLNEDRIRPGSGFGLHPHRDMEILLLPLAGAVAHADSLGHRFDVQPDEVLLMSAGAGIEHSQMNASEIQPDHHLQVWLLPRQRGTLPRIAHRRFERSGREGRWQLVASPDGHDGSLQIDQDAYLWRAHLSRGSALCCSPAPDRSRYLHVATGAVLLRTEGATQTLSAGDAVAWQRAAPFELSASDGAPAELLLFDLPPHND
jgi:quercetin 2,3-dioxygenase